MRVLILLRILWTAGAQKIAIQEAKELKSMGHDVVLVFLKGRKIPEYDELLEGVNYNILSEDGNSILSPIYWYITKKFMPDRGIESRVDYNLIRRFPKYVKNRHVDYIICHDQLAGLAGYYSFKKLGIKYSVFIHEKLSSNNDSLLQKIWHRYEYKILKNAANIFSITEKIAKTVEEVYNIKSIPNYPGMEIIKSTEFNKKENALIAVSMWDYGRKPELYLDIIENIPDLSLYFVGNFRIKDLETTFKEEIRERGLDNRVIMKQGIKESELIELYQNSKFAIRFGFEEYGIGTSVIEALENCVPLIMNSELGTAELIRKYNCGLVLGNINADEIKRFIDEKNEEYSYKKLQQNIGKLSKEYTWKDHAEKLMKI